MRAIDLAESLPLVTWATDAVTALQTLAAHRLAGLVVAGDDGVPEAVIPGPQLLRLVVPGYVLDDPHLAHVYDEQAVTELTGRLREHDLRELRDRTGFTVRPVVSVLPDDTVMEIAVEMCDDASPLVLVRDKQGAYHGVVTLARLTAAILELGGAATSGSARTLRVDLADHATGDAPDDEG